MLRDRGTLNTITVNKEIEEHPYTNLLPSLNFFLLSWPSTRKDFGVNHYDPLFGHKLAVPAAFQCLRPLAFPTCPQRAANQAITIFTLS